MTLMESLWPRLAELPLVVESCEYDRLHAVLAHEFQRVTTHVRLVGAGADGLGEDVSVHVEDGSSLHETQPALPLAGEWTLAGFCDHLATLDRGPSRRSGRRPALSQLGVRVGGAGPRVAPGRPRACTTCSASSRGRCASSTRWALASSPRSSTCAGGSTARRACASSSTRRRPGRRALVDEVAATGAVDTIDFKGQYGFEVKDPQALGALYDRVLAAFPDAYLEDPHDLPEIAERLGDHVERVSYDAPIHSAEDIGATPLPARVVNVKPSRIGSLRALFEVYARCARERRPMYGGGMGELGVGRGQIELLAALFHADAPNDVAPSAYNEDDPPGESAGQPAGTAPRGDRLSLGGVDAHTRRPRLQTGESACGFSADPERS